MTDEKRIWKKKKNGELRSDGIEKKKKDKKMEKQDKVVKMHEKLKKKRKMKRGDNWQENRPLRKHLKIFLESVEQVIDFDSIISFVCYVSRFEYLLLIIFVINF